MKRRIPALALLTILLVNTPVAQAAETQHAFPTVRAYTGQFSDVPADAWYFQNVAALFELGLTNGQGSNGLFAPDSNMTVAEALTMAARLRSLYEHGDSEAGPRKYPGGHWFYPYAAYLQDLDIIGQEFEGMYYQPVTRAQLAHILANTLPQSLFEPVNQDVVAAGYENGNYIRDVHAGTPYRQDILTLYNWGILSGMDYTGAFCPDGHVPRCQMAAMVTRMTDSTLRIRLDWKASYSKSGTTMADLVYSDGAFYSAPEADSYVEIDADVRYMLSQGSRSISLSYPAGTLTGTTVNQLLQVFLNTVRGYVEQTYNAVQCAYSARTGSVTFSFSSSLYGEDELEHYRDATMAYAIAVHDQLWAEGQITPGMSQYEKAQVYFTWICENCDYDFSSTSTSLSHTGYSVFANGRAVCDGYTAAYNLLLKLEGIVCTTISRADHIWTAAVLDGTIWHIDATWGDQAGAVAYQFFGMTEEEALSRFSKNNGLPAAMKTNG